MSFLSETPLALKGAIAREELSFPYSSLSLFYVTLKREREGERRKGMRGGMI